VNNLMIGNAAGEVNRMADECRLKHYDLLHSSTRRADSEQYDGTCATRNLPRPCHRAGLSIAMHIFRREVHD
jgi:hypothetical protein